MNEKLNIPVQNVKGIGSEKEKELNNIGIYTVKELLEHYPYRYEDHEVRPIEELEHDQRVTICGTVQGEPSIRFYGKKKSRVTIRLVVDGILVTAVFFNRAFVRKQVNRGDTLTVIGKWDKHRLTVTVQEHYKGHPDPNRSIEPVYSIGGSLTVKQMRKWMKQAIYQYGEHIEENLPSSFLKEYKIPGKKQAIKTVHHPESRGLLKHARRRIVYEEFLLFQLKMQAFKRTERMASKGHPHLFEQHHIDTFIQHFPFEMTGAQERVLQEILADMASPCKMNRLLQGDVGSGKTAVAAVAMYVSVLSGAQAALMVPTEILAEQHSQSLQELFQDTEVNIALLTGSTKRSERKRINEDLKNNNIHILVGTHALIQEDVDFYHLGLVITDEQHRFGVAQRRALKDKGLSPDVLFMTATPIPRTLAISVFGDMEVSVIDEMPAGRKPVETYWAKPHMLDRVLHFIEKELKKGRQAYVICPLIEESEKLDVQNAIDVYNQLIEVFSKWKVGLMHGRLPNDEKEAVMEAFSNNDIQVLVSTTVVEVGVNVPNASMMLIYDAERFGLAQLHQLRGRVGRGEHQSYCILLADPKSEVGKERMKIMTETSDGFKLSEEDLKLRGPGDFFGHKQSGLPEFKMADVVHDYRALEVAKKDAEKLVASDEFWTDSTYKWLRSYLEDEGILKDEKLD